MKTTKELIFSLRKRLAKKGYDEGMIEHILVEAAARHHSGHVFHYYGLHGKITEMEKFDYEPKNKKAHDPFEGYYALIY